MNLVTKADFQEPDLSGEYSREPGWLVEHSGQQDWPQEVGSKQREPQLPFQQRQLLRLLPLSV